MPPPGSHTDTVPRDRWDGISHGISHIFPVTTVDRTATCSSPTAGDRGADAAPPLREQMRASRLRHKNRHAGPRSDIRVLLAAGNRTTPRRIVRERVQRRSAPSINRRFGSRVRQCKEGVQVSGEQQSGALSMVTALLAFCRIWGSRSLRYDPGFHGVEAGACRRIRWRMGRERWRCWWMCWRGGGDCFLRNEGDFPW